MLPPFDQPIFHRWAVRLMLGACLLALPFGANAERRLLPEPIKEFDTGNTAVNALINRSRQLMSNGAPELAAEELERAIRISPRSALVWHELARVRFSQGRTKDAETLAKKADLLAVDSSVKTANHRLLNMSRVANGKPVIPGEQIALRHPGDISAAGDNNPVNANPQRDAGVPPANTTSAAGTLLAPPQSATTAPPADAEMQDWHTVPVVGAVDDSVDSTATAQPAYSAQADDQLPVVVERSAPARRPSAPAATRQSANNGASIVAPVVDRSISRR